MVSVDGLGEDVEHGLEAAEVALGEPGQRPVLEHRQVLMHPGGGSAAAAGEPHGEGAAVLGAYVAGDVPPGLQPVQIAGEGGALVGERPVQLGHRARAGLGQVGQEVRLALGETERRLGGFQVQADPVGGAVNERDQLEAWLHDGFG